MKPIRNIFALLVIIFVVTVSCTGFSQIDMNRELTDLHAQRIAMNNEITANKEDKGNTEKNKRFRIAARRY